MSNLRLVNDALMLISVLPEGQDASAEQGTLALRIASDLVDEWADEGIVVPWSPNATIDDDCPLVGTELNALRYALAVRLCPFFERDPSGSLASLSVTAFNRMARQQMVNAMDSITPALPLSEGVRVRWGITTDEL